MGTLAEAKSKGSDRSPLFDYCGQASSLVAIGIRLARRRKSSVSPFSHGTAFTAEGAENAEKDGNRVKADPFDSPGAP
jgi:hypothetical protein